MNNQNQEEHRTIDRSIHEQIIIANIYYSNFRNNNDDLESIKKLREEAEEGNPWARTWLGECYLLGITNDRENDIEKGIKHLETLEDFPLAQYKLAQWYLGEDYSQNKGKKSLKKAAKGGLVDAQYMLGVLYSTGEVFKFNKNKAEMHLKIARNMGHPDAQKRLTCLKEKTTKTNETKKQE